MSVEMITMLIGIASILLALGSGFGWMIHRMDGTSKDLGERIDRVDGRIDRLDGRIDRIDERLSDLKDEIVEVKIAIARVEGPPRQFLAAR
ncbi:response regulator [Microbacterium sp. H1-D42]|uniref:response regulator n=1 Tax=Microbacterium sp. H1-D42 TaxID=2925844 RepID=UPI001F53456F|nr:response regulator [Microbacterium sp. H1-D42]UNK70130.1 response regulator [Microbacterium sp. H1-D42]